jgi:hypothetical protein
VKLTVRDLDLTTLALSEEQGQTRTEGAHVSSIIKHIKETLAEGKENAFSVDDLEWFAIVGRLWERVLADVMFPKPRYERPGELDYDGVLGSPDCIDTKEWAVLEFKVCWKSSRDFENSQRFREYLWQVKAYCQMVAMVRARIIVFFVAGEWRPPVPKAKEYDLLFTPQELAENWAFLKRNIPSEYR